MAYDRNRSDDLRIARNRARRRMDYLQRRHRWRVAYRWVLAILALLAILWMMWMNGRSADAQEIPYVDAARWRGAISTVGEWDGFPMLEPTEGTPETYLPDWQYPRRPRAK